LPQVDGSRQNHAIQARRLAMRRGPSRSEVLRSLKERGLTEASLLAIGDGALGLWAALDEIFPTTRHQRCWNHRKLNVLDKLPKRLHPEVRTKLRALAEAPTRQECERRRDGLCAWLRARGQEPAAACLERDWADFVTYYDFPEEHWVHLRTSNPIESIFSGGRLRTNASKPSAHPTPSVSIRACVSPRPRPVARSALGAEHSELSGLWSCGRRTDSVMRYAGHGTGRRYGTMSAAGYVPMPQRLPWRTFTHLLRQRAKDYRRQTTRGQAPARHAWDGRTPSAVHTWRIHWRAGADRFPTPSVECLCV
jgi:hypothetical protein